jgi:hypothetical protein
LEGGARLIIREVALATIPAESVRAHVTEGDIVYDPVLGWKRTQLPNPLFGLDRNGFRHPEVALAKPPGRLRGFALGDSQTYGAGVDPGQDYPSVAERVLRARGLDVEVINAGLSGYTSRQAKRLIETKLLAFDPDFVVVDCRTRDDERDDGPPTEPGFVAAVQRVLFYSRLYRGLRLVVHELDPDDGVPMRAPAPGQMPPPLPPGSHLGNHDLIAALGDEHGFQVWFLDYPFKGQPAVSLVVDAELPHGARVVRATNALRVSGRSADELFLDNNHLTATGCALVGEALADALAGPLARTHTTP